MEHSLQCRIRRNNTDMEAALNNRLQESGKIDSFECKIVSITSFTLRTTSIAGTCALAGVEIESTVVETHFSMAL